ncbi:MAG: RNase adapter RapZ [Bifidobacteriaceae bacterium]|nr:RNase adapter RapZ [Bifidobacteriaceae bacterium]
MKRRSDKKLDEKTEENIVIITGLSGAGRSHASGVFEDLGYFVIDNAPPQIINSLIELVKNPESQIKKLALVADIRSGEYFGLLNGVLDNLASAGLNTTLLFLDASNDELVKRYESTRRPHPLQNKNAKSGNTLLDGIEKERQKLSTLKLRADYIIDTSTLSIHDLSRQINKLFDTNSSKKSKVQIISFGFKYGIPLDANFVIDVRFLPNPFWEENLRFKTGNDSEVYNWVLSTPGALEFTKSYSKIITSVIDKFVKENKKYITIAVGCTGGQHRSVAMANKLKELLSKKDIDTSISARDLHRNFITKNTNEVEVK